jgi:hypothetical protein
MRPLGKKNPGAVSRPGAAKTRVNALMAQIAIFNFVDPLICGGVSIVYLERCSPARVVRKGSTVRYPVNATMASLSIRDLPDRHGATQSSRQKTKAKRINFAPNEPFAI